MNKSLQFLITFFLLFTICGCVKEDDAPKGQEKLHEVVFHAQWAPETKTILQEDGSVWWSPGDEISLFLGFSGTGGYKLTSTNTEPSASVDFVGQVSANPNNNVYNAIYPYSESNRIEGPQVFVTIPSEQRIKQDSFAEGAFVSIARSSNENLSFKNICSGIKLSVANENITKIVISNIEKDRPIVGTVTVDVEGDGLPVSYSIINDDKASSSIIVFPHSTEFFKKGHYYYVALPPQTLNKGVLVSYYTASSVATTTMTGNTVMAPEDLCGPVTFSRGVVKRLFEKDKDLVFSPLYNTHANWNGDLPQNTDRENIKRVFFHTNNDYQTDVIINDSGDYPLYFKKDGDEIHFYTMAEVISVSNSSGLFNGWKSLNTIDLSNLDFSLSTDFSNMFKECYSLQSIDLSTVRSHAVLSMAGMFTECRSLKTIVFGGFSTEQVRSMSEMFANCFALDNLDFSGFNTSNVKFMADMFAGCSSLKSLDVSSFNTSNVEVMGGMFGSTGYGDEWEAGSNACCSLTELDLSTFNTSKVYDMSDMFNGCVNLERVNLSGWDTRNVIYLSTMFANCPSLSQVDLSSFNTENVLKAELMFDNCTSLKELDLSNFYTPNLADAQRMFYNCFSLRKLIIPHFSSESLQVADLMFSGCQNLAALDLGDCDYSTISNRNSFLNALAYRSDSLAIRCNGATKSAIENYSDNTFDLSKVMWIGLNESLPDMPEKQNPELYSSTDYTRHKQVRVYQKATVGRGVDIVLLGEAYSDRLIANGTYDTDMNTAIEALFSYEPMKSFKEYFNVYVVYAVSKNETHTGSTAIGLESVDTDLSLLSINDCEQYIRCAVHDKPTSDIATIIIGHDLTVFHNPGVTWSSYRVDKNYYIDYGQSIISIAFIARLENDDVYKEIIGHEFGHLFAKLEDEYYSNSGNIPDSRVEDINKLYTHLGVGRNIDFTNNPAEVKWHKFIYDSRYDNTSNKIGIFEGGAGYELGVWRPTEYSIMNVSGFGGLYNAPSREAIFNRIHKLAFGRDWEYDYEKFVEYDMINIEQENNMSMNSMNRLRYINRKEPHKPFKIINQSKDLDGKEIITVIMY